MARPDRTRCTAPNPAGRGRALHAGRSRRDASWCVVLLFALVSSFVSHAAPIGIRARTRVAVTYRVDAKGLTVSGRLVDDVDAPVAKEEVAFELANLTVVIGRTDADGRFEARFSRQDLVVAQSTFGAMLPWTFTFDGNSQLGPVREQGTLDFTKRPTRLGLKLPTTRLALGERSVEIVATLTELDGATAAPVADAEIAVEVGTGSELVGTTGRLGTATFVVRPDSLAAAGRYGVKARFRGDLERAPSHAEGTIDVILPTRVTLRVVREGDEVHGRYRFSGRLSDELGPIADAVVSVVGRVGEGSTAPGFERVVATRADGLFVTAVGAEEMAAIRLASETASSGGLAVGGAVRLDVVASYTPVDGVHAASSSRPIALEIPPPPGIPLRWYALALGLVLGLVLTLRGLRSGRLQRAWAAVQARLRAAWGRLVAWVRGLGRRQSPSSTTPRAPAVPGLVALDTGAGARRVDHVSGLVVDLDSRVPLGALISARRAPGAPPEAIANAREDGRFELGPLPSGSWLIELSCVGYMPRELVVTIPNAGELDGVVVGLVEIRRTVREVFQETVQALGTPHAWGFDTPRETARDALASPGNAARTGLDPDRDPRPAGRDDLEGEPLGELVELVERAHFARLLATPSDVDRARALQVALRPSKPADGQPRTARPPVTDGGAERSP